MNRYAKAGVNVAAGNEAVEKMKQFTRKTQRPGALGEIGAFGGAFDLGMFNMSHPVLVSGTDGVGTKLILAQELDQHETVGIDCVAMCVNDILTQGAQPLFFLDYLSLGKLDPDKVAKIVKGVADGCQQGQLGLIGGETAEMPGMYAPQEYDLAGFAVGVAEKEKLLTKEVPQPGDVLLGLPASGFHSNGYSLLRQIIAEKKLNLAEKPEFLGGKTLGEALLEPTKIYVSALLPILKEGLLHGLSHITGGGLPENLPRMFNDDLQAVLLKDSWPQLELSDYFAQVGKLTDADMLQTFNSGLGMVLAVSAENKTAVTKMLSEENQKWYKVGYIDKRPAGQSKLQIKRGA